MEWTGSSIADWQAEHTAPQPAAGLVSTLAVESGGFLIERVLIRWVKCSRPVSAWSGGRLVDSLECWAALPSMALACL